MFVSYRIVRKYDMMAVGCGGLLKGLWFAIIVLMCFQNWIVLVSSLFWWCFWFSELSQARRWIEGRILELNGPAGHRILSNLRPQPHSIIVVIYLHKGQLILKQCNNQSAVAGLSCPWHSTRKLLPFIKLFSISPPPRDIYSANDSDSHSNWNSFFYKGIPNSHN